MDPSSGRGLSWFAGFAATMVLGATAWAQDYTVTTASGLLESRPAGATQLPIMSTNGPSTTSVTLPFTFPYYGKVSSTVVVNAHGWLLADTTGGMSQPDNPTKPHGQDATSGAFPYSSSGDANGVIAPLWTLYNYIGYGTNNGFAYMWTTGSAPTRHVVFSWENAAVGYSTNARLTVQCHLYEGTGRIVFAYTTNPSSYGTLSDYLCGLDSPIDSRFTAPVGNLIHSPGYPGSDFILDPQTVTYTGTLLYDKVVSDATGIGNSTQGSVPLRGLRVELRRTSDSFAYAGATTTAADGSFTISGTGLPAATPGALAVLAQSATCRVATTVGGAPTSWNANASLSFAAGADQGTRTLGAGGDPSGDIRAALNVAEVCGVAYGWASTRTTDTIPTLAVVVDPASAATTTYQKAVAPNAASMQIASRNVANSDVWDDAVVTRTYAQHLLASIAGPTTSTYDDRFDAVTDKPNAFAQGFGCYLWAAISGTSTVIDGTSSTTATVYDLETPAVTVTKGPDVTGCMAGALYDLLDAANETADAVDGTLVPDRAFSVVDSLTVAPNAATFLQSWVDGGHSSAAITRTFIANFALLDDPSESNDSVSEAPSLGPIAFAPKSFVLNRFNEDWFSVTVPTAASSLMADAKYDQLSTGATVGMEIRDAGGALLATGTLNSSTNAVHAATGAVAAGTYRVGVRHLSGGTVPSYQLQAFIPPSMDAKPVHDWTVGRPYDVAIGARDGIAPYIVSASSGDLPTGLAFESPTVRVFGTPTVIGAFSLTVRLVDAGNPANVVQRSETVRINDVLELAVAPFVGFALGKSGDVTLPTTGGTPPFTLSMTSGALPSGLTFDPNSLHVTGTITAGPSSAFELDGVDVASSADHVATRGVVAHPASGKNIPADLVAGTDACGWWFDAALGSKVSFTATTAKGRVKRVLTGLVLAPDRSAVLTGKIKTKLGSLTGSGFLCPESGRYYVIASSTAGEATQLLGNVKVAPPKAGKLKIPVFAPADTTTVEVGAVPGATLTLKFAGQKSATLVARIVSVTDPTGTGVPFVASVKPSAIGGTLTMVLPVGGTWTIVLGATSSSGVPGKLSYSYAIKQPKGVTYSAD